MKSLQYTLECGEGCATPAGTMGMGNPAAPGPDGEPGSGDIPNAKAKRQKKKKISEGILDVDDEEDFGIEDLIRDKFCDACKHRFKANELNEDISQLIEYIKVLSADQASSGAWKSAQAELRSKNHASILYMPQSADFNKKEIVELRMFVKNPRPEQIVFSRMSSSDDWRMEVICRPVNHYVVIPRRAIIAYISSSAWDEAIKSF